MLGGHCLPFSDDKLHLFITLLGKRIKEIRKNHKLTQEQLSEMVGIETLSLSWIESGRFFPSLHVLDKMSSILNVELIEFFRFSNVNIPENIDFELTHLIQNQNEKNKFLIYKMLHAGFAKV